MIRSQGSPCSSYLQGWPTVAKAPTEVVTCDQADCRSGHLQHALVVCLRAKWPHEVALLACKGSTRPQGQRTPNVAAPADKGSGSRAEVAASSALHHRYAMVVAMASWKGAGG
ncbi:hypothetical protein BHM03_00023148 [Ensete ventricosum]|nr:hypothetical protein BHM03_00023148 [Ensete ventricosum]